MLLDQVEQLFLRFEVIIEARQRHAAHPRQVAHGGTFVALVVENVGRKVEDLAETAIEAALLRVTVGFAPEYAVTGAARHPLTYSNVRSYRMGCRCGKARGLGFGLWALGFGLWALGS